MKTNKKQTILIFAYYSYKDPVFQSAVLPYFINFPAKDKFTFILVTFEKESLIPNDSEIEIISDELKEQNIIWYRRYWHSGRFKFIKKVYDLVIGSFFTERLIKKHKVNAIYSEGFPGAVIAHFVAKRTGKPHIIHTFEPHTDYMVEAGVWNNNGWEARLLRYFEKVVAKGAHSIMTATNGMVQKLRPITNARLYRVPSCVDLDHFKFSSKSREEIRNKFRILENETVIAYLGKFGGMYWDKEVFEFFKACLTQSLKFKFFIFTPDEVAIIEELRIQYGIPKDKLVVKSLTRAEVPHFLSAADYGLVPVRQYPSKKYCSPIKDGEYWACGLPIVIPEGISDDYKYTKQQQLGIVIPNTDRNSFEKAANDIINLSNEPKEPIAIRCRNFAFEDRNVSRYKHLYKEVFENL